MTSPISCRGRRFTCGEGRKQGSRGQQACALLQRCTAREAAPWSELEAARVPSGPANFRSPEHKKAPGAQVGAEINGQSRTFVRATDGGGVAGCRTWWGAFPLPAPLAGAGRPRVLPLRSRLGRRHCVYIATRALLS